MASPSNLSRGLGIRFDRAGCAASTAGRYRAQQPIQRAVRCHSADLFTCTPQCSLTVWVKLHLAFDVNQSRMAALQVGRQRAWPLALAVGAAVLAVSVALRLSARLTLVAACVGAYLPSFLDGAEFSGERYWPAFAAFTRRYIYKIPATIEYEAPVDADQQYIFCSHPHGLTSAHHGLLLSGASRPCTSMAWPAFPLRQGVHDYD